MPRQRTLTQVLGPALRMLPPRIRAHARCPYDSHVRQARLIAASSLELAHDLALDDVAEDVLLDLSGCARLSILSATGVPAACNFTPAVRFTDVYGSVVAVVARVEHVLPERSD